MLFLRKVTESELVFASSFLERAGISQVEIFCKPEQLLNQLSQDNWDADLEEMVEVRFSNRFRQVRGLDYKASLRQTSLGSALDLVFTAEGFGFRVATFIGGNVLTRLLEPKLALAS